MKKQDRHLIRIDAPSLPALPLDVQKLMDNAKSKNTRRNYLAAWQDFKDYCADHDLSYLPANPSDLVSYLDFCFKGGLKVSTLNIRLASISMAHRLNKLPDPTKDESVAMVMAGIKRTIGVRPKQKAALIRDGLEKIVSVIPDTLAGIRDKAILLTTWASASRRNEIAQLNIEDLKFTQQGVTLLIRWSKTDQEGVGEEKPIPYLTKESICPVRALRKWLADANITKGPVFRKIDRWGKVSKNRLHPQVIALLVKKYTSAIGLDSKEYSGHSLRAGLITQAALDEVDVLGIQKVTHHKSLDTLIKYERSAGVKARAVVKKIFGE